MTVATATSRKSDTIRIMLPRMHPAQRAIKKGMGRFNVVCCGRRFGKDILAQDRAIYFMQRGPVAWLAPSYRMLADNFTLLANTLAPIITRRVNNERLEILGGHTLDFWSLENPDRVRGRKYIHAIINEAAMVAGLSDAWNMVIRPTLIDLAGSCDFYSTPKGLNDFYRLWAGAVDLPGWERFRYTSFDNPHIPAAELAELQEQVRLGLIPERTWKQEIMAEFVEDGAFFQGIDKAATILEPDEPEAHAGHTCVMGVDWALSEDYTVLTVACQECARVVDWQRFNQIDYTYQREKIVELALTWSAAVLAERNSIGEPNIEMLSERVHVLPGPDGRQGFNTTATTKPQLIQRLASGLESGQFAIPLEYADELRQFQVTTMASGNPRFEAPSGAHDDRVISLALAWWAISHTGVFFA